ncbi:hypothetical protein Pan44_31930 [Caulifigura coniformis]|uniref:DUF1559 domain-containing protein n=1 Tax=Caulifigura coniformis TaxID=2527983 RepID=A0A517SG98_9PLAN|nr:DUF1559 domain-containing protein [Caulifigura coniformis]QDT55151.1 hypothetical protein Pan44_31930 [Caulifigura coniformis]
MTNYRRGVSLLEILVSIFVIGILLALLLPAIQGSRQAAHKLECKSNLRQIGIALHNHLDAKGSFPTGESAMKELLPYVEQAAKVQYDKPIRLYQCPTDADLPRNIAVTSFRLNLGSGIGSDFNGVSVLRALRPKGLKASEITDGMSNTALASERRFAFRSEASLEELESSCLAQPHKCIWWIRGTFRPGQEDSFAAHCADSRNRIGVQPVNRSYMQSLIVWEDGYNHTFSPNAVACYTQSPPMGAQDDAAIPATSMHQGGVNLCLCDGSVRFVANGIDIGVWRALGTRGGGEPISDF